MHAHYDLGLGFRPSSALIANATDNTRGAVPNNRCVADLLVTSAERKG